MINSIKQKLEQINLIDTTDHKKAGVMIILLQNDNDSGIKILFTKRSSSLSTHSGEVSFPGGKWEEGDKDLYETALRESNEEINLDTKNLKKLGALNYLISRHKIEVHPYVRHLIKNQDFKGNYEIDEIFTVPLEFLMEPENVTYNEFKKNDLKLYIPSWVYNGNKIWGLTAMIAADFLNICFDAAIKTDFDLIRKYDEN